MARSSISHDVATSALASAGGAAVPLTQTHQQQIHQQLEVTMTDRDTPPDGGNAGKPMRAAISAALRREAEGDDGETAPTLALIVNKLISRALGGDMSAIKEILDRMDGKTAAGAIEDEGPRRVIVRWKD
jgi:predicted GTPase